MPPMATPLFPLVEVGMYGTYSSRKMDHTSVNVFFWQIKDLTRR